MEQWIIQYVYNNGKEKEKSFPSAGKECFCMIYVSYPLLVLTGGGAKLYILTLAGFYVLFLFCL